FSLKVELTDGVATRMGIVHGTLADKTFEIGVVGTVLELVPRATLDGMTLANLPGTSIVESSELTSDGHRLAVVRPQNDWTYADFRIFYGTDARMVERPVIQVSRGSATYLTFKLDGAEANAVLSNPFFSPATPSTLTLAGGKTLTLTDASTSTSG